MEDFIVVEESIVMEANSMCCAMGDVDNTFGKLLKTGEFYKSHGMTPIYTLDETTMTMFVKPKETMKKNLN